MDWILSYFSEFSDIQKSFIVIIMGCVGFIILILSIKRWLINR